MGRPSTLRRAICAVLAAYLGGIFWLGSHAYAQPVSAQPTPLPRASISAICTQQPDALQPSPSSQLASFHGTVTDSTGKSIAGAQVTLQSDVAQQQRTQLSNESGSFSFTGLASGTFRLTIASDGFAPFQVSSLVLPPGGNCELPAVALQIAPVNTDVEVVLTEHEVAEEQLKAQEKQRVLGVVPNFYTSYIWKAAPLTPKQKFRLALRSTVDPVTFAITGITAGVQQWQNSFSGYGQGGQGYAKRFGASYTDNFISTMLGGAVLPSVLHQDPRYFYKGTGSIGSRALYAISTVAICRGDNGRWQPNYSSVLGNLAAAGISNLYYPPSNRYGAQVTVDNALIGTAEQAINTLIQEFILRKISRGVHPLPKSTPPNTQP